MIRFNNVTEDFSAWKCMKESVYEKGIKQGIDKLSREKRSTKSEIKFIERNVDKQSREDFEHTLIR